MSAPRFVNQIKGILRFLAIATLTALVIILVNHYGVAQLRAQVEELGVWIPLGIFVLRFTSVVIPALPGTAYSLLAGSLLGFAQGLLIICVFGFYYHLVGMYGMGCLKGSRQKH